MSAESMSADATNVSNARRLELAVTPREGPLWQRRDVTVDGAVPGSLVTVRSETQRETGLWSAQATYLAGADGRIDLARDAPVSGDYRNADAMGLFWAQRRETANGGRTEPDDVRVPIRTRLTARAEPGTGFLDLTDDEAPETHAADGDIAGAETTPADRAVEVEQRLLAENVERAEVREYGLVGTRFRPVGNGPFPTVIVMNGSGGGINEARAALYASRGIQAFALGYFRAPGLSNYISNTPLEYFERALDYVAAELDPLGGAPIVSGQSRGGELTLLLGSRFSERIAGLVAFVPAAFAFGAQGAADPADGWSGPVWTWRGEPLEHLWHDNSEVSWQPWDDEPPPTRHADVYVDGMRNRPLARASRIPIERFRGPVACVSGLDDRAWPSSMASRIVMSALERHGHSAERLHLDYEDAGHGIGLPFLPSTEIERVHPVSGVRYSNGGTPRGNAHASADSFEAVCSFIQRAVK